MLKVIPISKPPMHFSIVCACTNRVIFFGQDLLFIFILSYTAMLVVLVSKTNHINHKDHITQYGLDVLVGTPNQRIGNDHTTQYDLYHTQTNYLLPEGQLEVYSSANLTLHYTSITLLSTTNNLLILVFTIWFVSVPITYLHLISQYGLYQCL